MLRGLDTRGGGRSGDEPTIIKVAGRERLEAEVTVYVDAAAPDADARREEMEEAFSRLQAADVVADASVTTWQEADVIDCYEEFVDAVDAAPLEPHFESMAGGNAIDVPAVAVAVRDGDDLTALYPQTDGDDDQRVEDCVRALQRGDDVENVENARTEDAGDDADSEAESRSSKPVATAD